MSESEVRMQSGYNYAAVENQSEKPRMLNFGDGRGITYRECRKNHAANIGGNVTDGCGEFMPTGEEGTLEALKCAACNCHRNFHRKQHHGEAMPIVHPLHLRPHWTQMVQPVKVVYGGGTDSSSEELNFNPGAPPPPDFASKKRFRTKFTAAQKEKMQEFAEKLGWRIPRDDDSEIQRFCAEVGVKRQVFKVWMHNNKNTTSSTSASKKTPPEEF